MKEDARMLIMINPKTGDVSVGAVGKNAQGQNAQVHELDANEIENELKPEKVKKKEDCQIALTNPCVYFMHGGVWYRVCY